MSATRRRASLKPGETACPMRITIDLKEGTIATGATTDGRVGSKQEDTTSASLTTSGGMEIYQFTESGLSLQATVQGTKYWKDPKLNQ